MRDHDSKLKSCPFCGGRAKLMIAPEVWIQCTVCGSQSKLCAMPETAVEKWNARVTGEGGQ